LNRAPTNSTRAGGSRPFPRRSSENPLDEREVSIALEVLLSLPDRSREALTRYYLDRESAEDIQSALGLSATEFRDLKAKAKERWAALHGLPASRKPTGSQGSRLRQFSLRA
jgi:DNA-directed RNA polymerase specialized sigma24 family protein